MTGLGLALVIAACVVLVLASLLIAMWSSYSRERARRREITRRHATAMRIDRIRRRAEDELLRSADVIDGTVTEEES
jgi:uncharacterized membrane protein